MKSMSLSRSFDNSVDCKYYNIFKIIKKCDVMKTIIKYNIIGKVSGMYIILGTYFKSILLCALDIVFFFWKHNTTLSRI